MRVLHVSGYRGFRGGESQLVLLARALQDAGAPQAFACLAESPVGARLEALAAGPVVAVRRPGLLRLHLARALAKQARAFRPDVVHLHDAHAHTAGVLAASLLGLRAPLIAARRVEVPVAPNGFSRWKYNHPAVRRILCVSDAVAEVLTPALKAPGRIRVVRDGTDVSAYEQPAQGRLHALLGRPPGQPIVGNLAALDAAKDPITFVRAAAHIRAGAQERGLPEPYFVWLGKDQGMLAAARAEADALGLSAHLALPGPRPDVPALLPDLALLLFTSRIEGLGTAVLEAFAAGVPVVATRAGGLVETVLHERTGLSAPPEDAPALAEQALRLLADPALAARLAAGARAHLEAQYTYQAMARATQAAYEEVLAEERGGQRGKSARL